uniref:Uncharacterized protein n=1 Tax=Candidatus Kentrum sp. LPFa TaxID=2126335 RepID=A0A450XQ07_9GAMM|nr:MAG: hypothetical protein BECKLPF1236A_GA0070988_101345 [Candidatus Kentron sp. LPFa]VFK31376.1 MAG: hypothetical protein BECKLPF1236C_GA0070990_101375 [Candidatus Kentron sp. LPFa]
MVVLDLCQDKSLNFQHGRRTLQPLLCIAQEPSDINVVFKRIDGQPR